MNRRNFALSLGAVGLAANLNIFGKSEKPRINEIIKPKMLKVGDAVSLIAPASNTPDPDDIQKALEICNFYGLVPKISPTLTTTPGYKSRSVEVRIDELNWAFSDKETSAVWCLRGGYGSGQILDKIDYELIKKNPKVFIGYSDITAMHLAIHQLTGLVTFHGPITLSAFTNYTESNFRKVIFQNTPIGNLSNPTAVSGVRNAYPIRTIVSGKAEGKLVGGNLSLITSLLGTDYEIDAKDRILFIEDVGEEPFRIDRMLNQLRLANKFEECSGIVFGRCNDCVYRNAPNSTWDTSLGEVLDLYFGKLKKPVFYGLMIGHTSDQLTLPYGIKATMDADLGTLAINDSAVI